MTRDRMPDLCAVRKNSATFGRGFLQDVHLQKSQNKKLNKVLEEVEEIRSLIQIVEDNFRIVKDLQNNVLSYSNREIQDEVDSRTNIISHTAYRVQSKLSDMEKDITVVDELTMDSAREGPVHLRIKILQYATMSRLFSEIMRDYNELLIRYQDKCASLLNQQRLLTRKEVTNEELQGMLDTRDTCLFVDNILEDSRAAKQQLSDLQTRHKEFLKLEKSITEVHDMFIQMSFLIEKQGEQLDCVEYFAGKATDNVDNGRVILTKAEKKSHKYRKRKIKIFIVIVIIVLILILIAVYA